jgi:hypothetical protein
MGWTAAAPGEVEAIRRCPWMQERVQRAHELFVREEKQKRRGKQKETTQVEREREREREKVGLQGGLAEQRGGLRGEEATVGILTQRLESRVQHRLAGT